MAFFSKPPAKKPELVKSEAMPAQGLPAGNVRAISARELATQAGARGRRPHVEPTGSDSTVTGASLAQWTPAHSSFEVAQANPGLCAVLENAALRYASGQAPMARKLLEEGIETDIDTRLSPLAWLALFDLLQRVDDKAAFDRLAMQYVVQFERSAPAWEAKTARQAAPRAMGGQVALTGRLTAASAPQVEGLKRAIARQARGTRLDLASVLGFDDAGARLLADALADARRARFGLQVQQGTKLVPALEAALKQGRAAGEGVWLLSLELLQWANEHAAFEDRAVEFAVAFEVSPPSWEPPTAAAAVATVPDPAPARDSGDPETMKLSGVLAGTLAPQLGPLADFAHGRAIVQIDMGAIERIDFVCAGALLNLISRIESQRKAVQIVGASPIIRALLLLIGVAPRHFVKKSQ